MKTYYVTKYVLTKGIIEVEGELRPDGWLDIKKAPREFYCMVVLAPHFFSETMEEAFNIHRQMKERKIASLEKQISKLKRSEPVIFKSSRVKP